MNSHTTARFRRAFGALPSDVRRQAGAAYRRFGRDPYHPSLRFKQVHPTKPVFSVRISQDYRALGNREEDEVIWFWIGPHAEYEKLVRRL